MRGCGRCPFSCEAFGIGDLLGCHCRRDCVTKLQSSVSGLAADLSHAPRAEGGVDLVGAEGGARLEGHGLRDRHEAREFLEPVLDDIEPRVETPKLLGWLQDDR